MLILMLSLLTGFQSHELTWRTIEIEGEPDSVVGQFVLGDVDGDGVSDIVAQSPEGGIYWYRGDRRARSSFDTEIPPFFPGQATSQVIIGELLGGDFNADGLYDLAAVNPQSLTFYLGDGTGLFRKDRVVPIPGMVRTAIADEVDRSDGVTDIVVSVDAETPYLLIFQDPRGAWLDVPERVDLPASMRVLKVGRLADERRHIVGFDAKDLVVVEGRNALTSIQESTVERKVFHTQPRAFSFNDVAFGPFDEDPDIDLYVSVAAEIQELTPFSEPTFREVTSFGYSGGLGFPNRQVRLFSTNLGGTGDLLLDSFPNAPFRLVGSGTIEDAKQTFLNADAHLDWVSKSRRFSKIHYLLSRPFQTLVVTKSEDTDDGVCDADCSLREAVQAANTSPGSDLILFSNMTENDLELQAPLIIQDDVTLLGASHPVGRLRVRHRGDGLVVEADNVTLRDLHFAGSGTAVRVSGRFFRMTGCSFRVADDGVAATLDEPSLYHVELFGARDAFIGSSEPGGGNQFGLAREAALRIVATEGARVRGNRFNECFARKPLFDPYFAERSQGTHVRVEGWSQNTHIGGVGLFQENRFAGSRIEIKDALWSVIQGNRSNLDPRVGVRYDIRNLSTRIGGSSAAVNEIALLDIRPFNTASVEESMVTGNRITVVRIHDVTRFNLGMPGAPNLIEGDIRLVNETTQGVDYRYNVFRRLRAESVSTLPANDPGDVDEGGNRGQNHPEILGVESNQDGTVDVTLSVDSLGDVATYPLSLLTYRKGENDLWRLFTIHEYTEADAVAGRKTIAFELDGSGQEYRLRSMVCDADGNCSTASPEYRIR